MTPLTLQHWRRTSLCGMHIRRRLLMALVVQPWFTSSNVCGLSGNSLSSVLSRQTGTSVFSFCSCMGCHGLSGWTRSMEMERGPITDTISHLLMFKQCFNFDCLVEESLQDVLLLLHVLHNTGGCVHVVGLPSLLASPCVSVCWLWLSNGFVRSFCLPSPDSKGLRIFNPPGRDHTSIDT